MAISFTPITFKNTVDGGASMDVNFARAQAAFTEALSRTNSSNNEMQVDLDMNSKEILNVKTDPSNPQSLLNVGEADTRFVQEAGDSMSGDLDMQSNTVTGLRTPTSPSESATKGYVDTRDDDQVSRTGDSMSGDLDMSGNNVKGVENFRGDNLYLRGKKVIPTNVTDSQAFESVSEMKLAEDLVEGQFVRTLGYYTPGDGGGNDYEIVDGATGTADGGSFIDLGSGLQAKGLFYNSIRLSQFGGATSSIPAIVTAATNLGIQKAVVDVELNNESAITITGANNIELIFTKKIAETTIKNDPLVNFTNCDSCNVYFLGITGVETLASWDGVFRPRIKMLNCVNTTTLILSTYGCSSVTHGEDCVSCTFLLGDSKGIVTESTAQDDRLASHLTLMGGSKNRVLGGTLEHFGNGLVQEGAGQELTVDGVIVLNPTDGGIYLSSADYSKVTRCTIEGYPSAGFDFGDGVKMRGSYNLAHGNTIVSLGTGIAITGYGGDGNETYTSMGSSASNNFVVDCETVVRVDSFLQGDGLTQGFVKNASITNNVFRNCVSTTGYQSLRIEGANGVNVSNNVFDNVGGTNAVLRVYEVGAINAKNITINSNQFSNIADGIFLLRINNAQSVSVNSNICDLSATRAGDDVRLDGCNGGTVGNNVFNTIINAGPGDSTNIVVSGNLVGTASFAPTVNNNLIIGELVRA